MITLKYKEYNLNILNMFKTKAGTFKIVFNKDDNNCEELFL